MADGWSTRPDNYDPQDPNTWSPEERVDYLTQAGFKWSLGNGNTALWTAPNGEPMNEIAAFTAISKGTVPRPSTQAAPNVGNSPDIRYDATGQAYEWDGKNWQPSSRFNDPTKAAGYRAPSTAAAPLPQTYTDRNGDLVGVDARSGAEVYRIPGATWAQISPAQQEQIRQGDLMAARQFALQQDSTRNAFTTQQTQQAQGFTSAENQKSRDASAAESAASRAQRAAEFAATQEAQHQGLQFSADQANAQGEAQASRDRLGAAKQYADLVSSTDTAALPAYLAAGGGVLWNAKANPQAPSLLTDNAINPAAASLRDARTIAWRPISVAPLRGFQTGQAAQTVGSAVPPPSIPGNQPSGFNPNNPNTTWMGPVPAGMAGTAAPGGQAAPVNTGSSGPGGPAGGMLTVNAQGQAVGFAGGSNGFIPAPQQGFYTSERGPEYMQVVDPPGADNAKIRVVPNGQMGFNGLPGYADGTSADPTGMGIDQSGLDPYAAEVRQFRQNFQGPQYGFSQFDPRFSRRLSTGMQNAYFNGQQTQSGAPAEALANEAAYYRPRGYFSSPYHVTPDLAY